MSKVDDYLAALAVADSLKPEFDSPSRPGFELAFVDENGNLRLNFPDRTGIPKEDALALAAFIIAQYR